MEETKFHANNFCCFHRVQMCQVATASFFGALSPIKLQVELGEFRTLKNYAHNSPSPPVLSSCVHTIHHYPGKPSRGAWWQWLSSTGVTCPPQLRLGSRAVSCAVVRGQGSATACTSASNQGHTLLWEALGMVGFCVVKTGNQVLNVNHAPLPAPLFLSL